VSFANTDQARFWSEIAPTWEELHDKLALVGGPPGRLAMDRLGLQPGQRVLDLGCGPGGTTVEIARRVGPGGRAVGVDIAEGMLEAGRRRAAREGVDNIEFVHADVQVSDLGEGQFDVAFSQFGLMFFADPVAAFTNIRRALRPGGRLAFSCWQNAFANEWMLIPAQAAMAAMGATPQLPAADQPGPFSLADPDRVRSLLTDAGFSDIDVAAHNDFVVTTEDRIPEVAATSSRVGAVADLLKDADDVKRRAVLAAIEEAMRSRLENGEVRATRGALLVTATG
jgi:SAM-dependent methyltransferase